MDRVLIGNIVTFIGAILVILMGLNKTKRGILLTQCGSCSIYALGNFVLGGYSGAITNLFTIIRNLFCFKYKMTLTAKLTFIILQCVIGGYFNQLGLIGWLPIIASVSFTWFLDSDSEIVLKIVVIFDNLLWIYYNFIIKSYVTIIVNIFGIIANLIGIYRIKKLKTKKNGNNCSRDKGNGELITEK